VKVKVYTGSHQRALRKGSQLVLALARAPPRDEKEKQQRLMRIRRVVSHAIRPAPSPPEASRSTSNPPSRSPIITVAVVGLISTSFHAPYDALPCYCLELVGWAAEIINIVVAPFIACFYMYLFSTLIKVPSGFWQMGQYQAYTEKRVTLAFSQNGSFQFLVCCASICGLMV